MKKVLNIFLGYDPAKAIASVKDPETVVVPPDTETENLELPERVGVVLADGSELNLQVEWNTTTYDKTKLGEEQELTGEFILEDGISNPKGLSPHVKVIIKPNKRPITSITPVVLPAKQNYLLGPTERQHPAGPTTVVPVPDKVWVNFEDGDREQLPVSWNGLENYDRRTVGQQSFTGDVIIDENSDIVNDNEFPASLTIDVAPETYYVWVGDEFYFPSVSLEVLLGTPVEKLDEILAAEGKKEVAFIGYGTFDSYLFEDITITGAQPNYDKDTSGDYTVKAYLPDNFLDMESGEAGYIPVSVTVLQPSSAVSTETVYMEARQSIASEYMDNIPTQVKVLLENGKTIMSGVEWNWNTYNANTIGTQTILGTLKDPPAAISRPVNESLEVKLQVNVIPMQYTVTGIENNSYSGDAGLTLSELGAVLNPKMTLNIIGTDGESTKYDVSITLKEEGSNFDPKQAQEYTFTGEQVEVSGLPDNITWPAAVGKTVTLTTNKVTVTNVAQLSPVDVGEGTPFDELELPTQVMATLSCKTANGMNKEMLIDIDWGSGNGYTPVPETWNEDGTATLTVTGNLTGCAAYISNMADVPVTIQITMTPAPTLLSISPWLFPASGALNVGVGTTLDEIYAMLGGTDGTHTVQLTLRDYQGNTYTKEETYYLRAEDNSHYNPSTSTGAIRLNAYLPLGNKIKNPDELKIQIQITVNQYTITGAQVLRLTRPAGLSFEELDLPEQAKVTRNDGGEEWLNVTWDEEKYNPDKITGMQLITGTFDTPLPTYLTNPNNIQPKIFLTISNSTITVLSLTPVEETPMALAAMDDLAFSDEEIPGIVEYRYWAEVLHEDGTITIEPYSIFELADEDGPYFIGEKEDPQ